MDDAKNPRSKESKLKMARHVANMKVKDFVPNDAKAAEIERQAAKAAGEADPDEPEEEAPGSSVAPDNAEAIEELKVNLNKMKESRAAEAKEAGQLKVEEFEKDVDENFHVDFIHAMANIRAANYGLPEMDWLTVKIKAGRIVPALATTTAAIAGLQTIEMLKIVKNLPIEAHKNSFLNLAVPSLMMGEPGPP